MHRTATIVIPDGYASAEEFAKDCGVELVEASEPAWDAPFNRHYPPVEDRAAEIYKTFVYDGAGDKPEWVPHGNSLKQDEARALARVGLAAAGHRPTSQISGL